MIQFVSGPLTVHGPASNSFRALMKVLLEQARILRAHARAGGPFAGKALEIRRTIIGLMVDARTHEADQRAYAAVQETMRAAKPDISKIIGSNYALPEALSSASAAPLFLDLGTPVRPATRASGTATKSVFGIIHDGEDGVGRVLFDFTPSSDGKVDITMSLWRRIPAVIDFDDKGIPVRKAPRQADLVKFTADMAKFFAGFDNVGKMSAAVDGISVFELADGAP